MAYNIPSYNTEKVSFGPGILYLGAAGATPLVDIGACENATFTIKRTALVLKQGSPKSDVARFCTEETVDAEISGLEYKLQNFQRALGGGTYADNTTNETLELGGDMDFTEVALRFVHQMAGGGTVTVDIYKANGSGELALATADEFHKFPLKFSALEATTNWAGATLAAGKKKIKITHDLG